MKKTIIVLILSVFSIASYAEFRSTSSIISPSAKSSSQTLHSYGTDSRETGVGAVSYNVPQTYGYRTNSSSIGSALQVQIAPVGALTPTDRMNDEMVDEVALRRLPGQNEWLFPLGDVSWWIVVMVVMAWGVIKSRSRIAARRPFSHKTKEQ